MGQQVTIGGDRIGSGKKMKAYLNDYNRSTHNLSGKFASSIAPGVLYPCLVKPMMRGDAFDIDIQADARTIPTMGALFGSFKMQVDLYFCPLRLYQALLHNNPLALGLNAAQVKMPLVRISCQGGPNTTQAQYLEYGKFSNSCLMKYLGISGVGVAEGVRASNRQWGRDFNAVPMLAYYDIFKNYYANKQEDNAYVISENTENVITSSNIEMISADYIKVGANDNHTTEYVDNEIAIDHTAEMAIITIKGQNLNNQITISQGGGGDLDGTLIDAQETGYITINKETSDTIIFSFVPTSRKWLAAEFFVISDADGYTRNIVDLIPFPLKNIDDMRYDILSHHELGVPFYISNWDGGQSGEEGQHYYLPYKTIAGISKGDNSSTARPSLNYNPMNGLVVKTYQNDMFNNWLNSEWIEGENGINELTKVEVTNGAFSMDALNFAQKLYNMLNRVAVAGGTYEDWQDVMFEQVRRRQIESPMYLGGMSQEIYFDEVIQTAPADGKPLGELGGRGRLSGDTKGGKIHVKADEFGFLIGIVSLTPRIFQTQGNEFFNTEIMSLDDFHKPGLDGIGFQDLIGERMAWFDTQLRGYDVIHRSKIGKLPAWIDYMTSVDRAYGDFAETEGRGYMILNRNYERDEHTGTIADVTTYIDPSKYNYAFADASLTAQNFWLEILFNIKARRLMSARIIPNV